MKKIAFAEPIGITDTAATAFRAEMLRSGYEVEYHHAVPASQSDLQQRIGDAQVLVISNYPLAASTLQACPNLKLIAVAFTGVDHIPLDYCREKGIRVCNAAGYSTQAVAELTLAMAVSLLRRIIAMDAATRSGGTRNGFLGAQLAGKTFGIVGLGAIGQRVARLAAAYGCKVMAYTRTPKDLPDVELVSLKTLFSEADIVSLHIPATPQTFGMVNMNLLGRMKSSAILINTARGTLVDCIALGQALREGRIAGAAIDVYEHEPPLESDHPLLKAPNTILLPHIAYATREAIDARTAIVLNNIRAWLMQEPQNVVV